MCTIVEFYIPPCLEKFPRFSSLQALGQREFDIGVERLAQFIENATFPVLSCNIDATEEPDFQDVIACSTVLTVAGESIAIVGFTDEAVANFTRTGLAHFLMNCFYSFQIIISVLVFNQL